MTAFDFAREARLIILDANDQKWHEQLERFTDLARRAYIAGAAGNPCEPPITGTELLTAVQDGFRMRGTPKPPAFMHLDNNDGSQPEALPIRDYGPGQAYEEG